MKILPFGLVRLDSCSFELSVMGALVFVGILGNLSVHVSRQSCHLYRQSICCTDKILKEIAV